MKEMVKKTIDIFSKLKLKLKSNSLEGKNRIAFDTKVKNCFIGKGTYIGKKGEFYNTEIGRFCSIGKFVKIIVGRHPLNYVSTHPAFYSLKYQAGFTLVDKKKYDESIKFTKIGNDVWIGDHVLIMSGIEIGDGAVIAAGSVVTKNIMPYEIWGGIPAKKIKDRFNPQIKEKFLKIKWWNKDTEWIEKKADLFSELDKFINICEVENDI